MRTENQKQDPSQVGRPPSDAVVELCDLSVRLGGRLVLDRLRADLCGDVVGLLGPNGAGKTTLLRTLLGFYPPASGDARVLGQPLGDRGRAIRAVTGYMPEDDAHIASMTPVRLVRYLGELGGLAPQTALERAHEALSFVGLGEARYRKIGGFSTGMKQLVKLAQALVNGPRLLLLDEPSNGLDPPTRKKMLDLIREVGSRGQTRILLSSHLLGDVEAVCDAALILKNGRVVDSCDLAEERRADRSVVEIELDSETPGFLDALENRGVLIEPIRSRRLKLTLAGDFDVREIFRIAAATGSSLRRLDHRRDSLQEIFLRAMEADDDGA